MSAALALADDGLTIEFESGNDECPDLTTDEAEAVTGRIRQWVNDFPIADVVLAFRGRVWIALAYDSWAEWCECELGGLKLPAPKRREVVAELASSGMSNPAIADAIGVDQSTVYRDKLATGFADAKPVVGQDGKTYTAPRPKPAAPEPEPVIDAEIVCRDCDGYGCETCVPEDGPEPTGPAAVEPELATQERKSRQRPLPDAFGSANYELRKAVERVVRLTADHRMKRNKDQIVGANLSDLIRARDALNGVIQQLEG